MIAVNHMELVHNVAGILENGGCKICDARDVFEAVSLHSGKVCHIIGSGWSLNHSISSISKDDYVIGFNFSAFADLFFDLYFVEMAGVDDNGKINIPSLIQLELLKEFVIPYTELVLFKNLWEMPKNDVYSTHKNYKNYANIVKDVIVSSNKKREGERITRILLEKDNYYFKQACSTALTCISLAAIAGFTKIVLHGIDFVGSYFYQADDFRCKRRVYNHYKKYLSNMQKKDLRVAHNTMDCDIPLSDFLIHFCNVLKENDIYLYSASRKSPSSKILPVYGT